MVAINGCGCWKISGGGVADELRLPPGGELSVNLSGRQVGRAGLAAEVERVLAASELPANSRAGERQLLVQASAIAANAALAAEAPEPGGASSNFGTGYSSLSYLQNSSA